MLDQFFINAGHLYKFPPQNINLHVYEHRQAVDMGALLCLLLGQPHLGADFLYEWSLIELASQPNQLALLPTAKEGSSKALNTWIIFRKISPYKLMDHGVQ